MIKESLVSIITIFLNEEQFILEAIDSVSAQTYDHWELLLVDDGSTDKSTEIAKKYAQEYSGKVRYLEHDGHQNRGMSASRNLGIQQVQGEYIAFLDADDVLMHNKLEQQVAIMESQPEAALVCGRAKWWYSWTGNPEDLHRDFFQCLDVPLNTLVQPPTLLTLFLKDEWASICDILVRREVVEAVGGYEESFLDMYEDQAFHAKLCLRFPVYVSHASGYWYRQHSEACTSKSHQTGQTRFARRTFLNWLENYLLKLNAEGTGIWRVLQHELWPYRHPILSYITGSTQRLIKSIKDLYKRLVQILLEH